MGGKFGQYRRRLSRRVHPGKLVIVGAVVAFVFGPAMDKSSVAAALTIMSCGLELFCLVLIEP